MSNIDKNAGAGVPGIILPMSGMIDIGLADPGFLFFKTKARFRVLLDGEQIGTMRLGETASFPAPYRR